MSESTEHDIVAPVLREMLSVGAATRPPESPAELRARGGRRTRRFPDPKLIVAVAAAVILVVALVTAGATHLSWARDPVIFDLNEPQ